MWKLLRNLLFAGVFLAGGCKLALWAAAQQQATELAQQLSPWGTLTWSGAGGDFDGVLTLSDVRFTPKPVYALGPVEARELRVRTLGVAWLLTRAVTRDTSVPSTLGVSLAGAKLPGLGLLEAAGGKPWIGRISMVPFETLGCGVVERLSERDYQAMGLSPQLPTVDVDYRYDSAERSLSFNVATSTPSFAIVKVHADLREFSPQVFGSKPARDALRVGQAMFDYRDLGYFGRRNHFCAQQLGVAPEAFVDQHVAAVQEFLKTHRIVPAEGVIALYRQLLLGSGAMHVLSLPNPNVAPAQYAAYDPEEVLRWLNLTARYNDSPPVLFKLFVLAPEGPADALAEIDRELVHDPLAEPKPAVPAAPAPAPALTAPAAAPTAATGAVTTATVAAGPGVTPAATVAPPPAPKPAEPVAAAVEPAPPATRESRPVFAPRPIKPSPMPATVASTPAEPATVPTLRVSPPPVDPRVAGLASAPAPPPGSTAALVWQGPGVDRLEVEEQPEEPRGFLVVAYDSLGEHVGSRVALITAGGKEIEGRIVSVDSTGITLSVQRDTGQAQFFVDRARILEIRVQRRRRG